MRSGKCNVPNGCHANKQSGNLHRTYAYTEPSISFSAYFTSLARKVIMALKDFIHISWQDSRSLRTARGQLEFLHVSALCFLIKNINQTA